METKYLILPINLYDEFARENVYGAPATVMIELTEERLDRLHSCAKLAEEVAAKNPMLDEMHFTDDAVSYVTGDPGGYDFGAFLEEKDGPCVLSSRPEEFEEYFSPSENMTPLGMRIRVDRPTVLRWFGIWEGSKEFATEAFDLRDLDKLPVFDGKLLEYGLVEGLSR